MTCKDQPITIPRGTNYVQGYQLGAQPLVYKPIAAKMGDTPLKLTVTGHGLPAAWSVALTDIGYADVDADEWPPKDTDDFANATALDVDTVEFNDIDLARLTGDYTAGGSIAYLTPVDLTGYSASFVIYDSAGTIVLTLTGALDNTAKTITFTLSAAQTTTLGIGDFRYAFFTTDSGGAVTRHIAGNLNISDPSEP